MLKVKVVHCKFDPYDVYIGRPSKWGNPFSHKDNTLAKFKVSTVEEAVQKYHEWILQQPELIQQAKQELAGKILGCWCRPKNGFNGKVLCHGQILVGIVDGINPDEVK